MNSFWEENIIFRLLKEMSERAEKEPSEFIRQTLIFLFPFLLLAAILSFKLSKMIDSTKENELKLAQMKKDRNKTKKNS